MKSPRYRRLIWFGAAVWILAASSTWAVMLWPKAVFGLVALLTVAGLFVGLGLRPPQAKRERRARVAHSCPSAVVIERPGAAPFRYPLLRPEDEAEVEKLYRRLKAVGSLDSKNSPDET